MPSHFSTVRRIRKMVGVSAKFTDTACQTLPQPVEYVKICVLHHKMSFRALTRQKVWNGTTLKLGKGTGC